MPKENESSIFAHVPHTNMNVTVMSILMTERIQLFHAAVAEMKAGGAPQEVVEMFAQMQNIFEELFELRAELRNLKTENHTLKEDMEEMHKAISEASNRSRQLLNYQKGKIKTRGEG